jgi:hypothetical protein
MAFALLAALGGCHGSPGGPDPVPSPSAPPSPVPGGTLQGSYILRVEPSATCGAPGTAFTFPVDATAADTSVAPGFSLVIPDTGRLTALEMELQYLTPVVRGSLGTIQTGEMSREAIRLWIRSVVEGPVTTVGQGPGQVMQGTMIGYMAFGRGLNEEGALGSCTSLAHHFSLTRP